MIAGGYNSYRPINSSKVEVFPKVTNLDCTLPPLPDGIYRTSLTYIPETDDILFCDAQTDNMNDRYKYTNKCWQMKDNEWIHHSNLSLHQHSDNYPVTVSMPKGGIFLKVKVDHLI